MADRKDSEQNAKRTSGNREESMTESGEDEFGKGRVVRDPDPSGKGDEESDATKTSGAGTLGQTPASSGTTSLGGEPRGGNPEPGPGGVEGEAGRS